MIEGAGVVVDPESQKVSEVLSRFINNEYDLKQMSVNARRNFETRFNLRTMIDNYSALINSI